MGEATPAPPFAKTGEPLRLGLPGGEQSPSALLFLSVVMFLEDKLLSASIKGARDAGFKGRKGVDTLKRRKETSERSCAEEAPMEGEEG